MWSRCGSRAARGAALALGLLASTTRVASAQTGADSVLAQRVSIQAREASLNDVLLRLRHDHGLALAWSGDLLPADRRVTLALRDEPLGAALTALLAPAGLAYAVTREGTVVIVASRAEAGAPPPTAMPGFATGVRRLDQIVVMGSAVAAAPEREQATAISVAGTRRLAEAPHPRTADLLRTLLPGVVLWDRGPGGPPASVAAVRGVSSFTTRGLKTYVDDIEVASPDLFTLLDGRSIAQMELMRGPQGAALYGPDALSGVLQITTRKGQPQERPVAALQAAAGPYQRADLPNAAAWQDYAGLLEAGAGAASGALSGNYTRTGAATEVPWLESWSGHAGGRLLAGGVVLSGSARAGRHEYGVERPGDTPAGVSIPRAIEERGAGLTARQAITDRWRHALMIGTHWISGAREPERSVLTPRLPLGATHETARRTSLRYATTVDLSLGGDRDLSLTAGAEHSRRRVERAEPRTAAASDLRLLYDDELRSTGAFAQSRLRLGSGVVLSGGARSEWLSSVGPDQGTSWAATAGLSWSHPVGASILRLRGAWGRGLRPPEPGMSRAMASPTLLQIPNADLAAESQHGVEAGAELHAGERWFVSVTWFDQRAEDLIQQVARRDGSATIPAYQFQNVGAIRNRGFELETVWRAGAFDAGAALYLTRSSVVKVAKRYTGEFQAGDDVPEVPDGVGVARLGYTTGAVRAEAGATWMGAWTGYDWAAALGTGGARAQDRDYWIRYPATVRPWVAGSVAFSPHARVFARVDNPAKSSIQVRDNVTPPVGRVALLGLDWRP